MQGSIGMQNNAAISRRGAQEIIDFYRKEPRTPADILSYVGVLETLRSRKDRGTFMEMFRRFLHEKYPRQFDMWKDRFRWGVPRRRVRTRAPDASSSDEESVVYSVRNRPSPGGYPSMTPVGGDVMAPPPSSLSGDV